MSPPLEDMSPPIVGKIMITLVLLLVLVIDSLL